jgi:hypothetical protein
MGAGRPRKEWTASRVRYMLASRPNKTIPVRELEQRVNKSRYPDRWDRLVKELVFDFHLELTEVNGTKVFRLLTQQETDANRAQFGLPPESSVSQ